MKTTTRIKEYIETLPDGDVFSYGDMEVGPEEYPAAAKALERLVTGGKLKRASIGLYYKPKQTVFGELKPAEEQLVRPYLFENYSRVAYITGTSLYNQMGLTTQVPKIIQIASRSKRIIAQVGSLRIQAVKSYVEVTDSNYTLLAILDAIKDFKTIPDMSSKAGIKILRHKIGYLSKSQLERFITTALYYPPRVRAFTGALLEKMETAATLYEPLKKSLNPLSSYAYGITPAVLSTTVNWNIA